LPFVTKSGGLRLDDGVVELHRNEKGETIPGNGIKVKTVANISAVGLDQESEEFKLAVARGNPMPNGTSWSTVPVFILDCRSFDKPAWERFIQKFEKGLEPGNTSPTIVYEPAIYDIVDLEYGKRALPLWVIKWLNDRGIYDKAVNETKVESIHKKLTPAQLSLIKKAIKERIEQEDPDVVKLRDEAEKKAKLAEKARKEAEKAEKARLEAEAAADAKEAEDKAKADAEAEELARQFEEEQAAAAEAEQAKAEAEAKKEKAGTASKK